VGHKAESLFTGSENVQIMYKKYKKNKERERRRGREGREREGEIAMT